MIFNLDVRTLPKPAVRCEFFDMINKKLVKSNYNRVMREYSDPSAKDVVTDEELMVFAETDEERELADLVIGLEGDTIKSIVNHNEFFVRDSGIHIFGSMFTVQTYAKMVMETHKEGTIERLEIFRAVQRELSRTNLFMEYEDLKSACESYANGDMPLDLVIQVYGASKPIAEVIHDVMSFVPDYWRNERTLREIIYRISTRFKDDSPYSVYNIIASDGKMISRRK